MGALCGREVQLRHDHEPRSLRIWAQRRVQRFQHPWGHCIPFLDTQDYWLICLLEELLLPASFCDSRGSARRFRWLVSASPSRTRQIRLLSTLLYNQQSSVKSSWLSVTVSVFPSSPALRFHDGG